MLKTNLQYLEFQVVDYHRGNSCLALLRVAQPRRGLLANLVSEELHVTLVHGDLQALGGGRRRGALPDSVPSFRPRRGEEEESRETADAHDCSADVRNASRRSASKACVTEERACGCGAREGGCVSERAVYGTGVLIKSR
jgi:hypothetical protein